MSWQAKFSKVEVIVLNRVLELLPDAARGRLESQLTQINKVQRDDDDAIVQLYIVHWFVNQPGKPESLFVRQGEFKLAKIELTNPGGTIKLWASVYVVSQKVFSIEFLRSPKLLGQNILVGSSQILRDPMEAGGINGSKSDVPPEALSIDYLEVAGSRINDWNIFAREEIYTVTFEGHELFILAEKDDYGWLASSVGDENGAVSFFFVRMGEYTLEPADSSLRKACLEN